jgi:hypothetical protein
MRFYFVKIFHSVDNSFVEKYLSFDLKHETYGTGLLPPSVKIDFLDKMTCTITMFGICLFYISSYKHQLLCENSERDSILLRIWDLIT